MTDDELHDAIMVDVTAKALADVGDDAGAALAIAPTLPKTLRSWPLTERGVIALFADPAEGLTVLGTIAAAAQSQSPLAPLLAKVVEWLKPPSDGIDFGHPLTRGMLDQLEAGGVLDADQVATLKASAEVPAVVTADDVSRAWLRHRPDGKVVAA